MNGQFMGTSIQDLHNNQQKEQLQQTKDMTFNNKNLDIEDLAKDINDNLSDDPYPISISDIEDELQQTQSKESSKLIDKIPQFLREPLLILIIYLILSWPPVQINLAKYIKQLQPDADCKVSFTGVLIYGIILVTIYAIAKKILLE